MPTRSGKVAFKPVRGRLGKAIIRPAIRTASDKIIIELDKKELVEKLLLGERR